MNCTKEESKILVDKYWEREWKRIQGTDLPDTREFPISDKHLVQEFKNLRDKELKNKAKSDMIHRFFPSIFTANKGGCLSPVEYWKKLQEDPELFKKFLENRYRCSDWYNETDKTDPEKKRTNRHYLEEGYVPLFIYSIGCTTSGKAPCVSYFKPSFVKNLINKYAPDCDTVFDPCTGYGKGIGALAAGKKYIGRDLNDVTIQENKNCVAFIEEHFPEYKGKANFEVADMFASTGSYDVLLTCPPYSNEKGKQIEIWQSSTGKVECEFTCDQIIDKLLRNYECNLYIFIVDDSMKNYRDYIKEKHENVNYINSRNGKLTDASRNYEAVVVITKEERDILIKGA